MLTIAEVSGLIAAAVMIGMYMQELSAYEIVMRAIHLLISTVQYTLPAAFVVILVKYANTVNNAVTWYCHLQSQILGEILIFPGPSSIAP